MTARRDATVSGALRRAALYRLLGAAFAYPSRPRLAELARGAMELAAAPGEERIRPLLVRLAEAARDADADALAAEHVTLFEGAARCPPYEGAYGLQQMSGKAAQLADIAGFYTAFGLAPAAGRPEVEDHIAAELEFMSALALKEAWAHAQTDAPGLDLVRDAAATFVTDHLGRWGEAFAARMAATGSAYHLAAATLLAAWLDVEIGALQATPSRVEGVAAADPAPFACPMAPAEPGAGVTGTA